MAGTSPAMTESDRIGLHLNGEWIGARILPRGRQARRPVSTDRQFRCRIEKMQPRRVRRDPNALAHPPRRAALQVDAQATADARYIGFAELLDEAWLRLRPAAVRRQFDC